MDLFHYKTFVFGVLLLIFMVSCNALICLFCAKFKIRILEFSIFAFKIKKVKIERIDYTLGWLPTISFVKQFGVDSDLFKKELSETELKTAFFMKENYKKALVLFSPSISYFVLGIFLPMLYLKSQSEYSIYQHVNYIIEFCKTIGGDDIQIKNFGFLTKGIVLKHSSVIFSYLLFSSAMFVLSLLQNSSDYLKWKHPKSMVFSKVFSILHFVLSVFLTIVIPLTLLSYFSFSEISLSVLNILIGIYSSGIIIYLVLINSLKMYFKEDKKS